MRIIILLLSITFLFTTFVSANEKVKNWMSCPKEVVEIETTIEIVYYDYDNIPELHDNVPVDVKPEILFQPKMKFTHRQADTVSSLNVWLSVLIDKEGKVIKSNIEIPSVDSFFNNYLINSALDFVFKPAILDGRPIFYWMWWKACHTSQFKNKFTIDFDEYLPTPDVFFADAIRPKVLKGINPEYPRLAKQAGIEGVVWVKVLVDKNGDVLKAQVSKTSGTSQLDQSALNAAFLYEFRPASQAGKPVAMWVSYSVGFCIDSYLYKDKN